jgi:hypothetical protein
MATYSYITLLQAKQQLANRLYDSAQQFWSPTELGAYLRDALSTWNALTSFWRAEATFPTVANQQWYELPAVLPTLRAQSVTDGDLISLIEYALLEPQTSYPISWAGSTQFTADDILAAIQRRRDELLASSGCQITRSTPAAVPGRTTLTDSVIDIRRVAYFPVTGDPNVLFSDDTWALDAYQRDYTVAPAGTPSTYRQSTEPPLSFDTDIAPGVPGTYEVLTVNSGATLSTTAATILPLPNDWCWVIRWGALADLLSRESNSRDPLRAQYCQQRYEMGASLLEDSPAVLATRIANLPLQVDGVQAADTYRTGWQAEAAAQPDTLLVAGLNLAACAPKPDGVYSVTATVVRNAPLPADDSSYLEVPRDVLDALLAYAQHLAAFKQGGAEFVASAPLFQRFLAVAKQYNARLAEFGEFTMPMLGLSQREESLRPRLSEQEVTNG